MFKQLKNIETSFKHLRLFTIVLIIANLANSCYIWYYCAEKLDKAQHRIYLLVNGKPVQALAAAREDKIEVEMRDHVRSFHSYFFSMDPDDQVIEKNISKALYLADGSAKNQYDNLKENGFYSGIISGNISQRVEDDSITVNLNQKPYYFRYYGKQQIIRPTSTVTRNLVTEGYIRDGLIQSDKNPHGYLIERWRILENNDLKVEGREH